MRYDRQVLHRIALLTSALGIVVFISDSGFTQTALVQHLLDGFYFIVLGVGLISTFERHLNNFKGFRWKVMAFDLLSVFFTLWIYYQYLFVGVPFTTDHALDNPIWIKIAVVLSFIREISAVRINYRRTFLNPAQLFVLSFMFVILVGAFLLMLPNATYDGISFIDALFTSTSAVSVTGLSVVETGIYFTEFGQFIIMGLIQVGGLGILTFSSYFAYFFKGGTTYENQLVLSDMTNSKKIGEVFSTLKNIILITVGIELFSGILIFTSLEGYDFGSQYDRIFFSVFHAISAFCNAGFSIIPDNLHNEEFRFNYMLQFTISLTFIFGGLGFPIMSNVIRYIKYHSRKIFAPDTFKTSQRPWVLNINSRITLITTLSITAVAFVLFYMLEYDNTLADHHGAGKLVTAFFGATTPRTAGFNSIDTASMLFPTTMMVFLLMWIGASPASTGGGIKTSTFAIATLNIVSLARGKTRIEVFRREIADLSVRRSFAVISLSFVVIGIGITAISYFDTDKSLMDISFECFSAYGTVGLSLGITPYLSTASKLVLVLVMFLGRVSMLTFVIAVFRKIKHKNYRYPTEEMTIN